MLGIEKGSLNKLESRMLGKVGVEYFADTVYRLEVANRLAKSTGTDHAIFFDDAGYGLPEAQRPLMVGLPGYERAMLPALLLAPGFKNGVSVLCASPPNPAELHNFKLMKRKMEHDINTETKVRLLYEQGNTLIDLMSVEDNKYQEICEDFAEKMEKPEIAGLYTAPYHLNLMRKHATQLLNYGKKAYVSPFQSTNEHHQALHELIEAETIVLPDMPNMDKAYNNFLLRKEGLGEYLHTLMAVHADGTVSTDYDSYMQRSEITKDTHADKFEKTETNLEKMANSILDCTEALKKQGMRSIIKLDSNGVSGLGNLMPDENLDIYDEKTHNRNKRLNALMRRMKESYAQSDTLPQFAVVEEFIDDAKRVDGFKYDLTAGGMMVDGVFMPMSMFPFGTDKDGVYDRGWIAARAELVREDPEVWKKIFKAYGRMGEVMAKYGYRNGVLAGDVLVREDGRIVFHDYNFRRGGRSVPEVLISLMPNSGLFEVVLKLDTNQGMPHVQSSAELVRQYSNICQKLTDLYGIYPFSTSLSYFGWGDGTHPFMKLRLLVPVDLLKNNTRNEHAQIVQNLVVGALSMV